MGVALLTRGVAWPLRGASLVRTSTSRLSCRGLKIDDNGPPISSSFELSCVATELRRLAILEDRPGSLELSVPAEVRRVEAGEKARFDRSILGVPDLTVPSSPQLTLSMAQANSYATCAAMGLEKLPLKLDGQLASGECLATRHGDEVPVLTGVIPLCGGEDPVHVAEKL